MIAAGFWFALPALALIAAFFILPVAAGLALSLSDFDIYALGNLDYLRFVGLGNYARLIEDPLFWRALVNTFYFVLVGGPLSVLTSLGAALLINSRLVRFRRCSARVLPPGGDRAGRRGRGLALPLPPPLRPAELCAQPRRHPAARLAGRPGLAMPAIILMAVWKNFGYNMIIFIAGLQSIPEQLYDSARIDGAERWQQLRYVTLPMLAPTFLFVGIMTMIG